MKLDSKSKKKLVIVSVVTLLLVAAMGYVIYSFMQPDSSGNYAKDIARPLEEALVVAGAVKVCERGDAGRGWDNVEPWYESYFSIPKSESESISIAQRTASNNGYSLRQASPESKGPLESLADEYTDKWYFDNFSKSSTYKNLDSGNVNLVVGVNANGTDAVCNGDSKLITNDNNSVISLRTKLPEFKR